MVASFDTMVLIWGVKKTATQGQEYMIQKTERFLKDLDDRRESVVLTAPVIAEYLGGFSKEDRESQLNILSEYFPIYPFDLHAAKIAADLLHNNQAIREIQGESGLSRQVIKADISIIAASIAAGANEIYSNDDNFRKAAQGKIIVKPIPDIQDPPVQPELF